MDRAVASSPSSRHSCGPTPRQTLIKSAEEADFDIVIFCTPSPQHQAAALGVARNVDAVVLVSEDARVQRRALRDDR